MIETGSPAIISLAAIKHGIHADTQQLLNSVEFEISPSWGEVTTSGGSKYKVLLSMSCKQAKPAYARSQYEIADIQKLSCMDIVVGTKNKLIYEGRSKLVECFARVAETWMNAAAVNRECEIVEVGFSLSIAPSIPIDDVLSQMGADPIKRFVEIQWTDRPSSKPKSAEPRPKKDE